MGAAKRLKAFTRERFAWNKSEACNKYLKRTGRSASPAMVDKYHKLMTSGSKYTEKFFKDKK